MIPYEILKGSTAKYKGCAINSQLSAFLYSVYIAFAKKIATATLRSGTSSACPSVGHSHSLIRLSKASVGVLYVFREIKLVWHGITSWSKLRNTNKSGKLQ